MIDKKITLKYALAVFAGVVITWLLHEFTHWVTSEALGYDSVMRLNSVYPIAGQTQTEWHQIYISASGPIITIVQALIIFLILKTKGWRASMYPLLFAPFFMRSLAGIMNIITPNDEGRIGQFFGIGTFTLSVIIGSILFFLVYRISKQYQLTLKFNLWTTILTIIMSTIIIMSDQLLKIQII